MLHYMVILVRITKTEYLFPYAITVVTCVIMHEGQELLQTASHDTTSSRLLQHLLIYIKLNQPHIKIEIER